METPLLDDGGHGRAVVEGEEKARQAAELQRVKEAEAVVKAEKATQGEWQKKMQVRVAAAEEADKQKREVEKRLWSISAYRRFVKGTPGTDSWCPNGWRVTIRKRGTGNPTKMCIDVDEMKKYFWEILNPGVDPYKRPRFENIAESKNRFKIWFDLVKKAHGGEQGDTNKIENFVAEELIEQFKKLKTWMYGNGGGTWFSDNPVERGTTYGKGLWPFARDLGRYLRAERWDQGSSLSSLLYSDYVDAGVLGAWEMFPGKIWGEWYRSLLIEMTRLCIVFEEIFSGRYDPVFKKKLDQALTTKPMYAHSALHMAKDKLNFIYTILTDLKDALNKLEELDVLNPPGDQLYYDNAIRESIAGVDEVGRHGDEEGFSLTRDYSDLTGAQEHAAGGFPDWKKIGVDTKETEPDDETKRVAAARRREEEGTPSSEQSEEEKKAKEKELSNAANSNELQTMERLLDEGVSADAKTNDRHGAPALFLAAWSGHLDALKLLHRHGANLDATDKYGDTALTVAAREGKADCVEALLGWGADKNAANNYGNTALINAALTGQLEIARLLVQHGANLTKTNKDGKTALDIAREQGNAEIVALLEQADTEAVGVEGTPSSEQGKKAKEEELAAAKAAEESIADLEELIAEGASADTKDEDEVTDDLEQRFTRLAGQSWQSWAEERESLEQKAADLEELIAEGAKAPKDDLEAPDDLERRFASLAGQSWQAKLAATAEKRTGDTQKTAQGGGKKKRKTKKKRRKTKKSQKRKSQKRKSNRKARKSKPIRSKKKRKTKKRKTKK